MSEQAASIDIAAFRDAFSGLAGAVSVLSVGGGDDRTGLTATSVSAFSAEPPTVGINVNTGSSSWGAIQRHGRFCINVLAAGQEHVAERFAGKGGISGADRYTGAVWTRLVSGAPVLEGALTNIDCELDHIMIRHSHALVIGRIVSLRTNDAVRPLLYWRRGFFSLDTPQSLAAE
ncbi:MAG: flavin reductase [Pelagibacterium sp. SCN 63-23]|nr:MAG: flavin reductase [Pelagibacterium sp. SCN 63-23]